MGNTARQLRAQLESKVLNRGETEGGEHVNQDLATATAVSGPNKGQEDFLSGVNEPGWRPSRLKAEVSRVLAELNELQAASRWEDIIALVHPVEEKVPELVDAGLDSDIRLRLSFALCRADRHDQAIACLMPVVETEDDNALGHYNIGYCVLDLFYRARSQRRLIPGARRSELLDLAHRHFSRAQELRPDSVTFYYREAILYKDIEKKPSKARSLFERAIDNWQALSEEERRRLHQQRPKYARSLYHLASCELEMDRADAALALLEKLQREDQGHVHPLFKNFAMGKVLHRLGRYEQSLQYLEVAVRVADRSQAIDYVHELAARNHLCMRQPQQAMEAIGHIPVKQRRPYVIWTQADALTALNRGQEAAQILRKCAERDRRARHIALIRLSRLALRENALETARTCAENAVDFCRETYGNPSREAQFWQAVALYRLGRNDEALAIVEELEHERFTYPNLNRLAVFLRGKDTRS